MRSHAGHMWAEQGLRADKPHTTAVHTVLGQDHPLLRRSRHTPTTCAASGIRACASRPNHQSWDPP